VDENLVIQKLENAAENGRITCPQALKIAEETGLPPKRIGFFLNKLKIKIVGCQLGCFR
jgi:hypothetical protein